MMMMYLWPVAMPAELGFHWGIGSRRRRHRSVSGLVLVANASDQVSQVNKERLIMSPIIGTERIAAIVPAAGKAARVHNYAKELVPIGSAPGDPARFIVCSEEIVSRLAAAQVEEIRFVISPEKSYLLEYYARNDLLGDGLVSFGATTETGGMPYSIASQKQFLDRYDLILMGMPDTVIDPEDSFLSLIDLHHRVRADLSLGLYKIDTRNPGGIVYFNEDTNRVTRHIDKTSPDFPPDADNSWAIACWNRRFSDFMYTQVESHRRAGKRQELLFGDLIDAAVNRNGLQVVAEYINLQDGFYWDITNPAKYFELIQTGHRGFVHDPSVRTYRTRSQPPSMPSMRNKLSRRVIFVSYSSTNAVFANNLTALLKARGIDIQIDSKNMHSGPLDRQIGGMIKTSSDYVLLLSNEALRSEWVQTELAHTRMLGSHRVHIVQLEDIDDPESSRLGQYRRSLFKWLDGRRGEVAEVVEQILLTDA
jgi:dTDP-glucose pyrophosphorylase